MKILITGTDGCVGGMLKERLVADGHDVFGTVFIRDAQEKEVRFNISNEEEFAKLPDERFDAIIHTVGIVDQTAPTDLLFTVNAEGTRRMLEWAKKTGSGHFIQISSVSVYGNLKPNGENRSEDRTKRNDSNLPFLGIPYMRSKAKAERYIEASGVPYTILRLPAVLGRNDAYLSPAIIPRLKDGTFRFCSSGDKLFSVLNVKNLPAIIEKLIERGPANDAFNCTTDDHTPWKEFVAEYARVLDVPLPDKRSPIITVLTRYNNKKWALIMTFSRFGGHYPNDKLKAFLGGEVPLEYSWHQGVQDAVAGFLEKNPD